MNSFKPFALFFSFIEIVFYESVDCLFRYLDDKICNLLYYKQDTIFTAYNLVAP